MKVLSKVQAAWVGGLFEGEGTIGPPTPGTTISVAVNMTDEDVIRDLHRIVGIGNVYAFKHASNDGITRKPIWQWRSAKRDEVISFLEQILPYLHSRRRQRAIERIESVRAHIGSKATHCPKGHEFTPENTQYNVRRDGRKSRRCGECNRLRASQHYKNVGRIGKVPRKTWD